MKLGPVWKMVAVVALGSTAVWSISYLDHIPPQRMAALLGITVSVSDTEGTPKPTPSSRAASPTTDENAALLGTVAIQTFAGPVLVRQGAGTSISSDGLILTTAAVAPYGSGSFVYQVATQRGQLLRARRVAGDVVTGLVLLKAESTDLDAVLFTQVAVVAGAKWEAISAQLLASRFTPMRLPIWVVWSDEGRRTMISMDKSYAAVMNGARVVDDAGRSVGLIRNAYQPDIIPADRINAFIDAYLKQTPKN